MRESRGVFRPALILASVLIFPIVSGGCAFFSPSEYYLFKPTVYELATKNSKGNVTDANILEFSNKLKEVLRERMNIARIARLFSGTFQVLTAASAAALGVASGSITAIAALSASSAVMPELQNIFEARERAEAYVQGVHLVEDAEGRYLGAVGGIVSKEKLTTPGATLYTEVLASLRLVEKALVAQLPTVEELQRATGRAQQIEVSPYFATILRNNKQEFLIIGGGPARDVVSSDLQVATAELDAAKQRVTVTGLKKGSTTVTAVNDRGGMRTIGVTVREKLELSIQASSDSVSPGGSLTYTLAVANYTLTEAKNVRVTVTLPAGMKTEVNNVVGTGWNCRVNLPEINCTSTDLGEGEAPPISLKAVAPNDRGPWAGKATFSADGIDEQSFNFHTNVAGN